MVETQHWPAPTEAQYAEASAVCHLRFPKQKSFDSPARFEAFRRCGVELVALLENGAPQAVSFLLPVELPGGFRCRFQFQMVARADKPGAGGLLMRQTMRVGGPVVGLGITPEAERLHAALRWKQIKHVWRGVHPLHAAKLVEDYAHRLPQGVPGSVWKAGAAAYNAVAGWAEWLLAGGKRGGKATSLPPLLEARPHLPVVEAGRLRAVDVGGIGRLLAPPSQGSLPEHAAIWRGLRQNGATAVEVLIVNEMERQAALRRGYLALPLELWYWDPQNRVADAIEAARAMNWSFLETDKVI
jgi:hypothetical protein